MEDFVDLDDVLIHAGEFELYQWLLFGGLAPFCLNMVFIYFSQFFITLVPDHWCAVPELIGSHLTYDERRNLSIPLIENEDGTSRFDSCNQYDMDFEALLQQGITVPNTLWPTKPCTKWEYDLENVGGYHSIVSEYDWVCDRDWIAPTAQSIFFVGAIVGGLFFGWAADRFGRMPALVLCNIIGGTFTLLTSTSSTSLEFFFYRFMAGIAYDNIFVMMYVLVLEYIGPNHRTLVANLSIAIFFTLGTVSLPWIAYGVKDWRLLNNLSALTMVISCLAFWFLPESARWLISCGRIDEAVTIVKRIAEINGKEIPDKILKEFKECALKEREETVIKDIVNKTEPASLKDLFKTPNIRKTTLAILFYWMMVNMVFDGHARNVSNLPVNVFIGFSVASLTELPADIFIILTLDRWGRRWLAFGTMVVSGVFSLISATVPIEYSIAIAALAFMGRFCVNMSMNIGLQYAAELLPTVVRAQGVAAVHIGGYITTILSPLIVYLGQRIPLIFFGCAAILGGIVSLFLPETLSTDLPQTIEDGEAFGKDQKFCSCPCIKPTSEESPIILKDIKQKPSFIRQRTRPSLRAETYRSSLIKNRQDVWYLPIDG